MASQKKGVSVDKKTETTFKTMENLRGSNAIFQEFIKSATSYLKSSQKLAEDGRKLADSIQKIAQLQQGNDLGDGIQKLADIFRGLEGRREGLCRTMQEDLIGSLIKSAKPEEAELAAFDSDYKKARDNMKQQIAKLEVNSKKAGSSKKGPEALKQAIATLNDKIKEADQIKADKLRNILLLERKKYCNFLTLWGPVISSQIDIHTEDSKFKENEQHWRTLASSSNTLPTLSEDLIKAQPERTFVQIQGGNSSEYSQEYDYSSTFDDYSTNSYGGSSSYIPPPPPPLGGGSYSKGGQKTAVALYDFAGEQSGDLPFYAGEIITVTFEDDGSGWLTGDLNGRSGIFPSSYVQRN